jgi:hypothetical protein
MVMEEEEQYDGARDKNRTSSSLWAHDGEKHQRKERKREVMEKRSDGSENECAVIEMERCVVNERERVASKSLVDSPRRQGERERRCG